MYGTSMDGLRRLPGLAAELHRRAPASVLTFGSLALSYLASLAYEDYTLFKSIGQGGLGKPSLLTWLVHTFVLRPLAMPSRAAIDCHCLPPDDDEWIVREDGGASLEDLPQRQGPRPLMFGMVPHRQLDQIAEEGSEWQKAIIDHLKDLADRYTEELTLAMSTYEATTSPCLFVRHHDTSTKSTPTRLSRYYLSGTPSPIHTIANDDAPLPVDTTKHELCHIHLVDGSLHLILAPQHARKVIANRWGELHRLAGMAYRGHWLPPYWLPKFLYNIGGGEQKLRWGYQSRQLQSSKPLPQGKLLPPTYMSIYAPTNDQQVRWVKSIIDASVAWATGLTLR